MNHVMKSDTSEVVEIESLVVMNSEYVLSQCVRCCPMPFPASRKRKLFPDNHGFE